MHIRYTYTYIYIYVNHGHTVCIRYFWTRSKRSRSVNRDFKKTWKMKEEKKKWWRIFIITLALWSTDEKSSRETGTVSRGYMALVMTFNINHNTEYQGPT